MIALTIGCAIACAALVVAEWRRLAGPRIAAKLVASAAFVASGLWALRLAGRDLVDLDHGPDHGRLGQAIVVGLVLGAIGDACLLAAGRRWFLAGLVAFLLGHLAYLAGFAIVEPAGRWIGDAGWLAMLPALTGLAALWHLWPRLGAMRLPVIAYVAAITAMMIAAIAAAHGAALPSTNRCLLVLGAAAFFASDLAVARDRFVAHAFANKLWGLPAYYAGQLLLAWAIR